MYIYNTQAVLFQTPLKRQGVDYHSFLNYGLLLAVLVHGMFFLLYMASVGRTRQEQLNKN
jgi:hypothetical protein